MEKYQGKTDGEEGGAGYTLDIELSNWHLILFDTRRLMEIDHSYDMLRNLEVLPRPSTDGKSIFWQDVPMIGLDEIMTMLNRQETVLE
ncbi:hypothetical protein KO465_08025 [Candidatus Micrarchaeota archaeon]|jgi:hypothetical protein|nr:hypothetical protein [Candidatus Micrarchaeota archaeon]